MCAHLKRERNYRFMKAWKLFWMDKAKLDDSVIDISE